MSTGIAPQFIFTPDYTCVKGITVAIAQVAKEKWGQKADNILMSLRTGLKVCLYNSDEKAEYAGYPARIYICLCQ
ncbi:hypothetical protein M5G07_00925 [Serratia symbiotica]|nr:hypothetical protein [Serratia symbiotica]